MTERHIVAEPPTDDAFVRAHALVLNRLTEWLSDERCKVEPSSERWRAFADVTETIHQMLNTELHPNPVKESAQPCGCDAGLTPPWVCEQHRNQDSDLNG